MCVFKAITIHQQMALTVEYFRHPFVERGSVTLCNLSFYVDRA